MATSKEYADFIVGQLNLLEDIKIRYMMKSYILYYEGKIFGGIYNNKFLVKNTIAARKRMPNTCEESPYKGAKAMLLVDEVDDKEFLASLIVEVCKELPIPKPKKQKDIKEQIHMVESRCGIVCSECTFKEKKGCKGCVNIDNPFWGNCIIKTCCESKSLNNCGESSEFPCDNLKSFSYDKEQGDNGKRIEQCKSWCNR